MGDGTPFTCKQCGSQAIHVRESGKQDEPLDAICTNCGTPFTDDDARSQLLDAIDELLAPEKQAKVFNIGFKK